MDYILVEGDKLYKLLKCRNYANVSQLPGQVKIFEHTINLAILEEDFHDSIAVYGDSFLTDVFTVSNVNFSSSCILFLCSYAVALFRYVNERGNVIYFLYIYFTCTFNVLPVHLIYFLYIYFLYFLYITIYFLYIRFLVGYIYHTFKSNLLR